MKDWNSPFHFDIKRYTLVFRAFLLDFHFFSSVAGFWVGFYPWTTFWLSLLMNLWPYLVRFLARQIGYCLWDKFLIQLYLENSINLHLDICNLHYSHWHAFRKTRALFVLDGQQRPHTILWLLEARLPSLMVCSRVLHIIAERVSFTPLKCMQPLMFTQAWSAAGSLCIFWASFILIFSVYLWSELTWKGVVGLHLYLFVRGNHIILPQKCLFHPTDKMLSSPGRCSWSQWCTGVILPWTQRDQPERWFSPPWRELTRLSTSFLLAFSPPVVCMSRGDFLSGRVLLPIRWPIVLLY